MLFSAIHLSSTLAREYGSYFFGSMECDRMTKKNICNIS